MRNSKALLEKIDKLDRLAEDIAGEISILERCRRRGLDYDDPSDYSAAALEAAVDHAEEKEEHAEKNSKTAGCKLQYSNPVETDTGREYNRNRISVREGKSLDKENCGFPEGNISGHGWKEIGDAIRWGARVLQKQFTGRVIHNHTTVRIAVCGKSRKDPNKFIFGYIWPGGNSYNEFLDVDGVIIAGGQMFYESKAEMAINGRIAKTGVIKLHDSPASADVLPSAKKPDVFYVNVTNTDFLSVSRARNLGWKIP